MKLVLDVGNTRIKWRMAGHEGRIAHAQAGWEAQLIEAWQALAAPRAVFAGSVASEPINQRVDACVRKLWPHRDTFWLHSQASCCGVSIQYAEPKRFGVDRFAALVAARAEFSYKAVIVVDAGTAMTVDVLDAAGLHQGGLIMPGLRLLSTSLMQGAAKLSDDQAFAHDVSCAPQHETSRAVHSGTACMLQGGVLHAVQQALQAVAGTAEIILTGGDQQLLGSAAFATMKQNLHRRESLVLNGLEIMTQEIVTS